MFIQFLKFFQTTSKMLQIPMKNVWIDFTKFDLYLPHITQCKDMLVVLFGWAGVS